MDTLTQVEGQTLEWDKAAVSRLFSAAVFRELATEGRSPLAARLIVGLGLPANARRDQSLRVALESYFRWLSEAGRRDDSVLRSALVQKIVLGRHSLGTTVALSELRAGRSKADIVVFNGTSTCYEIKSDRDSLTRLPGQLCDFRKTFGKTNVVVSANHVQPVLDLAPPDVGVIELTSRNTLKTRREAIEDLSYLDPARLLGMLRVSEASALLTASGRVLREVPNTQLRTYLLREFHSMDPVDLHRRVVGTIKKSRCQAARGSFVKQLPLGFRPLGLAVDLPKSAQAQLLDSLEHPLSNLRCWL